MTIDLAGGGGPLAVHARVTLQLYDLHFANTICLAGPSSIRVFVPDPEPFAFKELNWISIEQEAANAKRRRNHYWG